MYIKNLTEKYYHKGYYNDESVEYEGVDEGETDGDDYGGDDNSNVLKEYTCEDIYRTFKLFKTKQHINNYECSMIALMRRVKLWAYTNKLIVSKKTNTKTLSVFNFEGLVKHFKLAPECLVKF